MFLTGLFLVVSTVWPGLCCRSCVQLPVTLEGQLLLLLLLLRVLSSAGGDKGCKSTEYERV
jgi:hypothetical protein